MFQTCDACFKKSESLLQKLIENLNSAVTTVSDPNSDRDVSGTKTPNGNPFEIYLFIFTPM